MPAIPLRRRDDSVRAWVVLDTEDFIALRVYRWHLSTSGYARRYIGNRRNMPMHREIMGLPLGDPLEVDHINHDRLDNRRSNLRVATHQQNQENRRASKGAGRTSTWRGVSFAAARGIWRAFAQVDGQRVYLGQFDDETKAGEAAAAFRAEHMPFSPEARASSLDPLGQKGREGSYPSQRPAVLEGVPAGHLSSEEGS